MKSNNEPIINSAEMILPCADLDLTLEFFTERLGFRLMSIFPADDPSVAVISGYGLTIRLERGSENLGDTGGDIRIRLNCSDPEALAGGETVLTAPNGVQIEFAAADPPLILPDFKPAFVLNKFSGGWVKGRAGMRYRDLIPDRQGGRFIASHIHIPDAGPVPDYVHFHKIHFQMIYCRNGWARLVYEDQGEPFTLSAGDCVLQPPMIRHRVLESSADLEVIEFTCPAEHETHADHELTLPTAALRPERVFSGQRFIRSIGATRNPLKWRIDGFECRDTGIGAATGGLAGVKTVRAVSRPVSDLCRHDANLVFFFILRGTAELLREIDVTDPLESGDSLVIPAEMLYSFANCSADLEMLEVALPEKFETTFA